MGMGTDKGYLPSPLLQVDNLLLILPAGSAGKKTALKRSIKNKALAVGIRHASVCLPGSSCSALEHVAGAFDGEAELGEGQRAEAVPPEDEEDGGTGSQWMTSLEGVDAMLDASIGLSRQHFPRMYEPVEPQGASRASAAGPSGRRQVCARARHVPHGDMAAVHACIRPCWSTHPRCGPWPWPLGMWPQASRSTDAGAPAHAPADCPRTTQSHSSSFRAFLRPRVAAAVAGAKAGAADVGGHDRGAGITITAAPAQRSAMDMLSRSWEQAKLRIVNPAREASPEAAACMPGCVLVMLMSDDMP